MSLKLGSPPRPLRISVHSALKRPSSFTQGTCSRTEEFTLARQLAASGLNSGSWVELAIDFFQAFVSYVGVDLCGPDVAVP
jgi:hypothetical protein